MAHVHTRMCSRVHVRYMYNTVYNNMFICVPMLLACTATTAEMKRMVQDVIRTVGATMISTLKQQIEVQIRNEVTHCHG